jgi:predicted phage baseplate assembly protein
VLAEPLAYCYRRDTLLIHGNVAKASHGEQRTEVLGSGDATIAFQRFILKRPPLTYLPSATAMGATAALEVRVDEVEWEEVASLVGVADADRRFVVRIDDDGTTSVVFGDGQRGARLPTGIENVQALYRTGIGRAGNLGPGQLRQLATRPLGVSGVTNPLRSSGGADREGIDSARASAPRTVTAFGRFVSVSDAEDFARTFAGIGKASAARLSDGQRQVVHLTIAGVDDIPVDPSSDLHRNLVEALRRLGDPFQAVEVESRELRLLTIEAGVRIEPDRRWDLVEPDLRAALLAAFGFGRRELGQDVVPSEVLGVMQLVPGVAWVDLEVLRAVGEADLPGLAAAATTTPPPPPARIPVELARSNPAGGIDPAQLALLHPDLPDTLLLKELPP